MSPFAAGALGALVVLLLAGIVRRARWHRRLHRAGRGPWFMRRLFRHLGTRPEQEAVVSAEADALGLELRALRQDARALRAEVADLLAAPALDAAAVVRVLEPRLEKLQDLKARLAAALSRTHAALDPAQRSRMADLLRGGPLHRLAAWHC